jgi:hypothetical protein
MAKFAASLRTPLSLWCVLMGLILARQRLGLRRAAFPDMV